jgi:hypothetical protein
VTDRVVALAALWPSWAYMLLPGPGLTWEPVSGFEPLTCRLQDGCSAD